MKKVEEKEIPQTLPDLNASPEILEKIAEKNPKALVAAIQHSFHSGPLPPASELAEYDKICPGLATRIVVMAEKEQDFSHGVKKEIIALERQKIETDHKAITRGQISSLVFAVLSLFVAAFLGYKGHEWLAGFMVGVPLATVIGVFTYSAHKKSPDDSTKE